MGARGYLAETLHWNTRDGVDWPAMIAAGLGMAVPILIGAWTGHLSAGLAAAVGGLLVGNAGPGNHPGKRLHAEAVAIATTLAAAATALAISGHGSWSELALPPIAGIVALLGGYSRPLAQAGGRFILFLVITLTVSEGAESQVGFLLLMTAGALSTAGLVLAVDLVHRGLPATPDAPPAAPPPGPTHTQRFARWKRTLRQPAGWQYTLRLTACLAVAGLLRQMWPEHHYSWVVLTVALLCQRELEPVPVRVTQRTLGAIAGVAATGLLVAQTPPLPALAAAIGVLAALRPWLRNRNYLVYSAGMTPLIILILDAGRPVESGLLLDRLVATLVGAALVVTANLVAANLSGVQPSQQ